MNILSQLEPGNKVVEINGQEWIFPYKGLISHSPLLFIETFLALAVSGIQEQNLFLIFGVVYLRYPPLLWASFTTPYFVKYLLTSRNTHVQIGLAVLHCE